MNNNKITEGSALAANRSNRYYLFANAKSIDASGGYALANCNNLEWLQLADVAYGVRFLDLRDNHIGRAGIKALRKFARSSNARVLTKGNDG